MFIDRAEMKDDNNGDLWGMRKGILRREKIASQSYKNIQQVCTCVHIMELMLAEKFMWISFLVPESDAQSCGWAVYPWGMGLCLIMNGPTLSPQQVMWYPRCYKSSLLRLTELLSTSR